MLKKSPYDIVFSKHVTEKSKVLEQLQFNSSNPSVKKCSVPKYVFIVDKRANKQEISEAIEEIYRDRKVKVISVNTINTKAKARRMRGRQGMKPGFKKAIVTLEAGDKIEDKI
jgi:large subunit ribosomal protein L23